MGNNKDDKNADNMSNSMKKRIERQDQQKKAKRSAITGSVISILILTLIAAGVIYLISAAIVKASYKVQEGDLVELIEEEPKSLDLEAQDLNLNIVFYHHLM